MSEVIAIEGGHKLNGTVVVSGAKKCNGSSNSCDCLSR